MNAMQSIVHTINGGTRLREFDVTDIRSLKLAEWIVIEAPTKGRQSNVQTHAKVVARKAGMNVITKRVPGGVRVWRVE